MGQKQTQGNPTYSVSSPNTGKVVTARLLGQAEEELDYKTCTIEIIFKGGKAPVLAIERPDGLTDAERDLIDQAFDAVVDILREAKA